MRDTILRIIIAALLGVIATASNANPATIVSGVSLMQQTNQVVSAAGYRLIWRLPVDAAAGSAAQAYSELTDALFGVSRQMSATYVAANGVAPVICEGTKTIVMAPLSESLEIVRDGQAYGCAIPQGR
ncbi:hypothetical protein [Burkholderia sp. Ac-20365]|uniref:hypothetical protein n=1 Tax=Burkholderia sp. Ac-20365 TaxID=2703897 RepID=UPI00197B940C|nr:hypothetical protein [Burkholderia sp. Ac-20365]MBN3761327.1 hypothetical protein [Burkholderia sp. Ac-20365]